MKAIGRLTVAVALPLVALAQAAAAQVAGIPVYFNPRGGTGVSAAVNAGFPNDEAGGGKAYALTGGLGAGPLYLTATVGRRDPDGPDNTENTFGGTASLKLFGGGLIPVAIAAQAGIGIMKCGSETCTDIPIGVGIEAGLPLFPIKPWIAPRIQLSRIPGPSGMESERAFRVSAGVNFNLMLGLGFHAAVDMGKEPGTSINSTILGVGAHWNFRVPIPVM